MTKDTLISDSELPVRLKNHCKDFPLAERRTVGDLTKYHPYNLYRWKGVGLETIQETKVVLARYGLKLADD